MTRAIIKSGDSFHLSPFGIAAPVMEARADEISPSEATIAQLQDQLAEARRTIAQLREASQKALQDQLAEREKAYDGGFDAGKLAAERLEAERLARLREGVASAVSQFGDHLRDLERDAITIARETLDIICGDPQFGEAAVMAILSKQLKTHHNARVIEVHVSANDFSDNAALAHVAHVAGIDAGAIVISQSLAPGSCIFRLADGENDASLGQQWSRLRPQFVAPAVANRP